jgi:anti-anti-sigma regulatory factor
MTSSQPGGDNGIVAAGSGDAFAAAFGVHEAAALGGHIRCVDGVVTLSLTGEFDLASREVFRRMLATIEATAPRGIEIDVRELDFMGLSEVHELLDAQEHATGAHSFAVLNGSGPAHRTLELVNVKGQLVMVSRDAAPVEPQLERAPRSAPSIANAPVDRGAGSGADLVQPVVGWANLSSSVSDAEQTL